MLRLLLALVAALFPVHTTSVIGHSALGTPIRWGGCMRFEKVIDPPLLETARRGGCAMILYGLESASQRVMDFMVKGTQLPVIDRVLRQSHEAGIWNHTFFFFGFPGETLDDAQQTVNFLYEHKQHINSAGFGGIGPDGSRNSFDFSSCLITSSISASIKTLASRVLRPWRFSILKIEWSLGRRMSASIISTLAPV